MIYSSVRPYENSDIYFSCFRAMSIHKIPARFKEEVRTLLYWIQKRIIKACGMIPTRPYPLGWFILGHMDDITTKIRFLFDNFIGGGRHGAACKVVVIEDKLCASLDLSLFGNTKVARFNLFLLTFHTPNDVLHEIDI